MKTKLAVTILATILFVGIIHAQAPNPAKIAATKADPSLIPDSYDFSWRYTMEMQIDTGKVMTANYRLEKNADYFGINITQPNGDSMVMITDTKNKIKVTAFDKDGKKVAMAHTVDEHLEAEKKKTDSKFTYKSLPNKTILGYKCKGVAATSPEYTAEFYYTEEAPVNFAELFKSQAQKMPDMFKDYFKPSDKPLMMSVDITDIGNKKTTHTRCVALEKELFAFKKADYKFR